MRIRLRELLDEREMSAYALVKESGGLLSMSTIYRLLEGVGREGNPVRYFDGEVLDALCYVLGVTIGDLLVPEAPSANAMQWAAARPPRRAQGAGRSTRGRPASADDVSAWGLASTPKPPARAPKEAARPAPKKKAARPRRGRGGGQGSTGG